MMWWRIELDSSGAILKCTRVESVEENKRLVCYIQATDKAEACSAAKAWWARRRASLREKSATARAVQARAGLCTAWKCKRPPKSGARKCQEHLDRDAAYKRRQHSGESRPWCETAEEAHNRSVASRKAHVVPMNARSILKKFDALGPEKFRAWLVSEIERRSGGAASSVSQTAGDGVQLPS